MSRDDWRDRIIDLRQSGRVGADKYRFLSFHCRICGVGLYNIPVTSCEPLCRECAAWALKVLKAA